MRRKFRWMRPGMLAAAAVSLVSAGGPAAAATLETARIANWTAVAHASDQTGEFSHCSMSVAYQSGTTLRFAIDRRYDWAMALLNPAWQLPPGQMARVNLVIDEFEPVVATAKAVSPSMMAIQLKDDSGLFDLFRRGLLLRIGIGRDTYNFRLDGTAEGLAWLLRCVTRYEPARTAQGLAGAPGTALPGAPTPRPAPPRPPEGPTAEFRPLTPPSPGQPANGQGAGGAPAAPGGVASVSGATAGTVASTGTVSAGGGPGVAAAGAAPPGSQPAGSEAASIEMRSESTVFLASLMAGAGVSDYRVMPPSDAPEKHRGADAIFATDDGVMGTVRIVPEADPRGITERIVANDARTCAGQYASGNLPAPTGRAEVAHIFTGCEQTGAPAAARYTVLTRRKGGHYVIGLYAQGAEAVLERLRQVDNSVRQASNALAGRF
ncbi:hypothetical protein [Prosthecodimorpha staleyi]|uniref:Uncharacterized protein n=1 Tax=Prosthecodimorpha staleyi TaxID=2840188 RepID=A0A947GD86_9HYPH|nr:hypothetical protein [Prosthecodimorpha staleyi]MBT9288020.1 hypothetical protein [Prosthecodimorpha staleyi]